MSAERTERRTTLDSRPETYEHIAKVRGNLSRIAKDLIVRADKHDASKLVSPEVDGFDRHTNTLRTMEYGTPEYEAALVSLQEALQHHYSVNDHHPEHFPNGFADMSLIQLTELVCDWMAATERMNNGDIMMSIELNAERFGYGEDMVRLLKNTVEHIRGLE